ncbi:MAG: PfkB family carbohydrate kinase [Leptolinea sp.]
MDIVCQGTILMDMFPDAVGKRLADVKAFFPTPGGAPANVAVAATRLGRRCAFIGKVGSDAFGENLIRVMNDNRVDITGMRVDKNVRTTVVFIAMPDENNAEFVFYRNPGADLCLRADEIDETLVGSTKAFHCDSLSLVREPARSAHFHSVNVAKKAGAIISFDVNYRPSLWDSTSEVQEQTNKMVSECDVLKVNEIELELLTGSSDPEKGATSLLQRGPQLVAVTLGPNGSFFCSQKAIGFVASYKVKTIDAIGCGDAFMAGLLTKLTSGLWLDMLDETNLKSVFRFANAVGAVTALTRGVIPALPTTQQVNDFIQKVQE